MTDSSNPLLTPVNDLPDFDRIKPEDVVPAVTKMLADCEELLTKIESQTNITWDTIIRPLDHVNFYLHKVWGPVNHLTNALTSDPLRKAHEELIPQSRKLFSALSSKRTFIQGHKDTSHRTVRSDGPRSN